MKTISLKMVNINYYHSISKVILITFLSIITFACSNDDEPPVMEEEPPVAITELSEEIKELIYFKGDEKASTVLITIPGGPSTKFDTAIVDDLVLAISNKIDLLTVNVHQAQTIDSTIVKGNDITLDKAVDFNMESIEMLHKVASYFQEQGRTVYIFGFSFGAFVTQELIARKGIDSADKYLIIAGRLDIDDVLWQASAEGKEGRFDNGVTPIIKPDPDPDVTERNLLRLSAGLGMNRYTELLNPIENLSKLTYVYGETDEAVGSLTSEEVQFLESKNATVISGKGDHGETFFEFIVQGMKETFGIEIVL